MFGILIPNSLRLSQKQFISSLEFSIKISNKIKEIDEIQNAIELCKFDISNEQFLFDGFQEKSQVQQLDTLSDSRIQRDDSLVNTLKLQKVESFNTLVFEDAANRIPTDIADSTKTIDI